MKLSNDHNGQINLPDYNKAKDLHPFTVPEGYFDRLPSMIQNRISETSLPEQDRLGYFLHGLLRPMITVAAVALLVGVGFLLLHEKDSGEADSFFVLTLNELIDDYPETIEGLDENSLIETLLSDGISQEMILIPDINSGDSVLQNKDFMNYLLEENFESELLYNL